MIVDPKDDLIRQMRVIAEYFLNQQKPLKFNPYEPDNILKNNDESFEEVCAVMEENGIDKPKQLSEFEFYSRLKYYKDKADQLKKYGTSK